MIHSSNPRCGICGERHSDAHPAECRDTLYGQLADARSELIEKGRLLIGVTDERDGLRAELAECRAKLAAAEAAKE